MVSVYWLRFLSARHLPADVDAPKHTKQERTARGPVVYIQRVRAQGPRKEPSPTASERKRAHAAEDTSHAHVLLHTGMTNTQGQSYAKALQCRIHVRPSSHTFTAPGRRKTEVEYLREADIEKYVGWEAFL